jgi:hypothetical protein
MSLCSLPESSYVSFFGIGSYVPITSSGLLLRAVLFSKEHQVSMSNNAVRLGEGLPCVGDDDIVEGLVDAAEAREADFDDHLSLSVIFGMSSRGRTSG